jgi:hypothetical protein
MATLSRWDIGACNCVSCMACFPCNMPAHDLRADWTNPTLGGGNTTLFWNGAYLWQSNCIKIGTFWYMFQAQCDASLPDIPFLVFQGNSCASFPNVCTYPPGYYPGSGSLTRAIPFQCATGGAGLNMAFQIPVGACAPLTSQGFTQFNLADSASQRCACGPMSPCTLPQTNLHLNYNRGGTIGTANFNIDTTLCFWSALVPPGVACVPPGDGTSFTFTFNAKGNVTEAILKYWTSPTCTGAPFGTYTWRSDGSGPMNLTLSSYTCSPLSITFSGGVALTVTIVP